MLKMCRYVLAQSNTEEDKNQMSQVGISPSKLCGSIGVASSRG